MQAYIIALMFPAVTGVFAWLFLHRLSMTYAITSTIWCIVFLEYWRLEEISLSLRWKTRGVGSLKV
jgi:anoctamin-10